jgi:hypothetical protein
VYFSQFIIIYAEVGAYQGRSLRSLMHARVLLCAVFAWLITFMYLLMESTRLLKEV